MLHINEGFLDVSVDPGWEPRGCDGGFASEGELLKNDNDHREKGSLVSGVFSCESCCFLLGFGFDNHFEASPNSSITHSY